MADTPDYSKLALRGSSSHDTYHHDGLNFTETTRTVLEGQLAQRVRRRFDVSKDTKVWIKERHWEGGSECTRTSASEFVVGSGDTTVTLHPDDQRGAGWEPSQRDSVYARFNHWLNAGHSDARCWDEWVAEDERDANSSYVKLPLPLEAGLGAAAAARSSNGRVGSAYLWGKHEENGWHWELHTIQARGIPRPEYDDVFHPRAETLRMGPPTRTAATAATDRRRILMWATDQVMPGRGPSW